MADPNTNNGPSKVVFGDDVIIDLTEDTVTEDTIISGYTAHTADGRKVVGNVTSKHYVYVGNDEPTEPSVEVWLDTDDFDTQEFKTVGGISILGNGNIPVITRYDQYPVGSIIQTTSPVSPASLYGGIWERIKDMFLLGAGDIYALGATGGEAMHALTVDELPSHSHSAGDLDATLSPAECNKYSGYMMRDKGTTSMSGEYAASGSTSAKGFSLDVDMNITVSGNTGSTGNGAAHNNMPPYKAVYIWERIG